MKTMRRFGLALLFLATIIANSCTNLDDVENRLDALEEEVSQIQDAIKALEDAYSDGKVILSVEPSQKEEGGWVINFSDGTSIELLNGADGKEGLDCFIFYRWSGSGDSFAVKLFSYCKVFLSGCC